MFYRSINLFYLLNLLAVLLLAPVAQAVAADNFFNNIPTGYTVPATGGGSGNMFTDFQYNDAQSFWGSNPINFGGVNNSSGGINNPAGGINNPAGGGSGSIENPLAAGSIPQFINQLLDVVIQIGVPVLVVMIVFVGYKFVAAQGNSTKLDEAKEAFKWTIIGAAIVLGAFVISSVIQATVNNLGA